ncbi:MAG: glutamate-5-semialdehyde dehydrogenase [Pseudomonadota bacterium]|nr:glutamate-5-semialdehyde dehydrogenase [Pseudomonadota bacterium]
MKTNSEMEQALVSLRQGNRQLRGLSAARKNKTLIKLAEIIESEAPTILSANLIDLKQLPKDTTAAFRDRLALDQDRVLAMVQSLREVANLTDPVGEVIDEKTLSNNLRLKRVRSPLGLIFMIFESRPNVILEAFSLAFKSGNSIILRGGSDSGATSKVIYGLMANALSESGVEFSVFYGLQDYDRGIVENLLKRKNLIDVVVPRGGEKLIDFVQSHALMPIIKNDRGLCHTYVDEDADLEMAVRIVANAKTQRPGVCNALETVLVHQNCAKDFIPKLYQATESVKLTWRVDQASLSILKNESRVQLASPADWDTEYLDLIMNCRIVSNLDSAIEHIERHGSKHSEAIVTSSEKKARNFQNEVDAAAVYWNASTRFTDGFEFGLGGELGISTQKIHVRGPVGLRELTTPRWIIDGDGQVR